jgi:hypothetical protein
MTMSLAKPHKPRHVQPVQSLTVGLAVLCCLVLVSGLGGDQSSHESEPEPSPPVAAPGEKTTTVLVARKRIVKGSALTSENVEARLIPVRLAPRYSDFSLAAAKHLSLVRGVKKGTVLRWVDLLDQKGTFPFPDGYESMGVVFSERALQEAGIEPGQLADLVHVGKDRVMTVLSGVLVHCFSDGCIKPGTHENLEWPLQIVCLLVTQKEAVKVVLIEAHYEGFYKLVFRENALADSFRQRGR